MVRLLGYPTGVAMLAGMVFFAVIMPAFSLGGRLGLVALGLIGLLVCHFEARVRIIAGPTTVTVRNHLSTRTVSWEEILGVSFPMGDPWAHLDLHDGRTLATMALQRADGRRAVDAAHRLAALVRERGEAAPGSFPGAG
ncbi:MAG TPA: PH domain-containing protein [Candidatus Brachybacterium merdigallinarum]|nr:PH domain-containing protein [Candidatus Brachybacterium merdigallinarum]